MDKLAIEAFLYSADCGEDHYMLASSSSSESEPECCCGEDSDSSTEKLKLKRPKVEGFAEVTVPRFTDGDFKQNFRVTRATCEKVTELIYNNFLSDHKGGWEKITPTKAAYVLLWYLACQETFKQISERFKITQSCIHNIVRVGCRDLSSKLEQHVKWPGVDQYEEDSKCFYNISGLARVIGAIGVSHVKILKPRDDNEKYSNVRNYHSIAVQGIVSSSKKFINLYVCEGSLVPVEIFNNSPISSKIDAGLLGDYFLIGDNSYPDLQYLVTPFQNAEQLTSHHRKFNQCHDKACHTVNDAFSMLKGRFQRLNHLENRDIPFIMQCIEAACVVHNICVDCEDACEEFTKDEGIFDCEALLDYEYCEDTKVRKIEVFRSFLKNSKGS